MSQFCGKCGAPMKEGAQFCPMCGQKALTMADDTPKTPPKLVLTPEQKAKQKQEKKQAWSHAKQQYKKDNKQKKKDKRAALSKKQKQIRIWIKIGLLVLLVAAVAVGVYFALDSFGLFDAKNDTAGGNASSVVSAPAPVPSEPQNNGSIGINNPPSDPMPPSYEVSRPNADQYYAQNGTVISQTQAAASASTEATAYQNLISRGFTTYPITTEYNIDGSLIDEKEITATGTEQHPVYTTVYTTQQGMVWGIYEIGGQVFANPVGYNTEYNNTVPVLLSESTTITSYDSQTSKYYVNQPFPTVTTVKTVARIDAVTLENMTVQEMTAQ
ncbi:MAG: zinc ribbon domain-containing protein [Clostridia bacterium]|nr:zinc ribbon domain-containing protein [Clostridia bacterium]